MLKSGLLEFKIMSNYGEKSLGFIGMKQYKIRALGLSRRYHEVCIMKFGIMKLLKSN